MDTNSTDNAAFALIGCFTGAIALPILITFLMFLCCCCSLLFLMVSIPSEAAVEDRYDTILEPSVSSATRPNYSGTISGGTAAEYESLRMWFNSDQPINVAISANPINQQVAVPGVMTFTVIDSTDQTVYEQVIELSSTSFNSYDLSFTVPASGYYQTLVSTDSQQINWLLEYQ